MERACNYNKPPRGPLVGLLNFSVVTRGGGGGSRRQRAGFAFRQPLARDLRQAVTHRTHLFLCYSLRLSLSRAACLDPVEEASSVGLFLSGPSLGPFRRFDRTPFAVASRLVDPSFPRVHPVAFSFPRRKALLLPRKFYRYLTCPPFISTLIIVEFLNFLHP